MQITLKPGDYIQAWREVMRIDSLVYDPPKLVWYVTIIHPDATQYMSYDVATLQRVARRISKLEAMIKTGRELNSIKTNQ